MKRNQKTIEADLKKIKEAAKTAKTFKQMAMLTGLSVSQIKVSLSKHPIIHKRILAALEANKNATFESTVDHVAEAVSANNKDIVICDCPALLYGFKTCRKTQIVIPEFVRNTLLAISGSSPSSEGSKAKKVLSQIACSSWCTVVPNQSNSLLVDPETEVGWRSSFLVSLACKYWTDGYNVTIKTRTGETAKLARLQEIFEVIFVESDGDLL